MVELDVGGGHTAPLVVTEAQPADLLEVSLDVGLGGGARMRAGLHGVLLCGQPEGVEAHRVQDVVAVHPVIARVHIGGDEAQRVTDVQPRTRRIREHVLDEQLGVRSAERREVTGQFTGRIGGLEGTAFGPIPLPALLDLPGQVRGIAVLQGVVRARGRRTSHLTSVKRCSQPPYAGLPTGDLHSNRMVVG